VRERFMASVFPAFMMGIQLAFPLMASPLSVKHSEICEAGKRRKSYNSLYGENRRKYIIFA
jgi:hypothetical protein